MKKTLEAILERMTARNLLISMMALVLIIVSLSFLAGPDPRLKVYVFGDPAKTTWRVEWAAKEISPYQGYMDIAIYTESDALDRLRDFTTHGAIDVVVVGDTRYLDEEFGDIVYPALDYVPRILVLGEYKEEGLATRVLQRYLSRARVVESDQDLRGALYDACVIKHGVLKSRPIYWGFNFDQFSVLAATVALASEVLILLGTAFACTAILDAGNRGGVESFAEALIAAFFVFVFTQTILTTGSSMLQMPIMMHAGFSPAKKMTAVSLLGYFSGGSYLRFGGAILGYILAVAVSIKRHSIKLSLKEFIITGAILAFVYVITSRIYVEGYPQFSGLTLRPTSYTPTSLQEYILSPAGLTAEIVHWVGSDIGAEVLGAYYGNRSTYLYFAGSMTLVLFPKAQGFTKSVTLIGCSLLISRGMVGLGNIMPMMTYASVVPGILFGFSFIFILMLTNTAERYIRMALVRARATIIVRREKRRSR